MIWRWDILVGVNKSQVYLSNQSHTVTFTLSLKTRPMLRRSTTSPVACEHKNRSLVNTRIPRYPPTVSTWHGLHTIHWTPAVLSWEWLHRHPLWGGSLAIHSLPHRGKTPLPSAVSLWEDSLSLRLLPIAVGWVPTGRPPMGKLLRYLLVTCCIAVLSLGLHKETPGGENPVGRLSRYPLDIGVVSLLACSALFQTTLSVSFSWTYKKALVV